MFTSKRSNDPKKLVVQNSIGVQSGVFTMICRICHRRKSNWTISKFLLRIFVGSLYRSLDTIVITNSVHSKNETIIIAATIPSGAVKLISCR